MNILSRDSLCRMGSLALLATTLSCQADLGPRDTAAQRSFGEIVYREVCQRVLYTTAIARCEAHPTLPPDGHGGGPAARGAQLPGPGPGAGHAAADPVVLVPRGGGRPRARRGQGAARRGAARVPGGCAAATAVGPEPHAARRVGLPGDH